MRLDLRKQILTLVVTAVSGMSGFAAPSDNKPDSAIQEMKKPIDQPVGHRQFELDSVEIREQPAPRVHLNTPEFTANRVVRKHSRTVLTGLWTGSLASRAPENALGVRLDFQNDNSNETGQSYGLTILANNFYGAHWDYHVTCCLGGYSEFFWGLGIGSLYDPAEALASLVNLDRYRFRARAGFEDLLHLNRRLRGELIVEIGPLGFDASILFGWTWDKSEFIF